MVKVEDRSLTPDVSTSKVSFFPKCQFCQVAVSSRRGYGCCNYFQKSFLSASLPGFSVTWAISINAWGDNVVIEEVFKTKVKLDFAKHPVLSIITVCRNEGERIRATSESVVGQTCGDFEWIVMDGGSTDGTLEILKEYRGRMAHFVSEPDGGVYFAMNKGAGLTRGEWLLFLNGGDLLAGREVLERVLPLLGGKGEEILVGECLCTWPDGRPARRLSHAGRFDLHSFYTRSINHQSAFIGRRVFERFGPYDVTFRLLSDHDFFVRAVLGGVVFRSASQLVVEYDMTGMTADHKENGIMMTELRRIRRRYPLLYRIRRLLNDSYVYCRDFPANRTRQ